MKLLSFVLSLARPRSPVPGIGLLARINLRIARHPPIYESLVQSRADMLVHRRTYTELLWEVNASHHRYKIGKAVARPCNNAPRPFYFFQRGSGIGGANEDGRNVAQRCRCLYGSGPAEAPGPQAA